MKVLVYGCGVIGSYLVHVLCAAGNDVTVAARGKWRDTLEQKGLRIRHKLQKRETVDYPKVTGEANPDEAYDLVFSVMQGQQQKELLPTLAKADAPIFVLVGNNLEAEELEAEFAALSAKKRSLLFGFQGTAGLREEDRVTCVRFGNGSLNIGGLHREAFPEEKTVLEQAFAGSPYRLKWTDDMYGWLYCHAAFILPIVYVSYACGCDLRKATKQQIRDGVKATEEAYGLIAEAGIRIRPEGDEKMFRSRPKMLLLRGVMRLIAGTSIGELAATDHCRNAVTEMEWLDRHFNRMHNRHPEYSMPVWDRLRCDMPSWVDIHRLYDRKK